MKNRPLFYMFAGLILGEGINSNLRIMAVMAVMVCLLFFRHRRTYCGFFTFGVIMGFVMMLSVSLITIPDTPIQGDIAGRVVEIGVGNTSYIKCKPYYVDGEKLEGALLLYCDNIDVLPGQLIQTTTKICPYEPATNPGQFDLKAYYKCRGIYMYGFCDSCRVIDSADTKIRTCIYQLKGTFIRRICTHLSSDDAGVLCAVLLGDKSYLDHDIKQKYQENGVAHMLVISGLHISLIGGVIYRLLKRTGLPTFVVAACSFFILIPYVLMIGSAVASLRAVIMLLILIGADIKGRSYDFLTSASISGMMLLFESPLYLFDAGFLLSFSAVMGIGIILPIFEGFKGKHLWAAVGIWLSLLPVQLWFFYEVNVWSIVINLIIIPILPVLLGSGFLGIMTGKYLFFMICHYVLSFYEKFLIFKGLIIGKPTYIQVILYLIALILGTKLIGKRKFMQGISMIFVGIMLIMLYRPSGFSYTMLDVGQGECNVIATKNHQHLLIDGGSSSVKEVGTYRILPYLKSQGIRKLDAVIVTHFDEDHYNGICELIESGYRISTVYYYQSTDPMDAEYTQFRELCKEYGVTMKGISQGDSLTSGDMTLSCIYPKEEASGDKNELSLVFLLESKDFKAILTGDLEKDGEEALVDALKMNSGLKAGMNSDMNLESNGVDLLKVGHHGSKNATSDELLELIHPQVSFISCGKNNRYGHPHQEVIERLKNHGVNIFRTDEYGAIWYKDNKIHRMFDTLSKTCYTTIHEND